jgi:hypothetical protein
MKMLVLEVCCLAEPVWERFRLGSTLSRLLFLFFYGLCHRKAEGSEGSEAQRVLELELELVWKLESFAS